ncbi:hypothetical protein [Brachyspira hyodysenteriae]|uniref:hypothetical protein n=1 Tax=Brachyspira hyodysenteriae TaxID=159 RepID=UPI001182C531|nr:hypothetical protein [Brachyspira hyodysenteriae]TVL62656.1 hypothetical protein A9X85_13180 [Brachyspira hyodysenteriae]TVL79092.1 hypothetical protein A9X79_04970 [Brachyspira hyodysenteriae]
MNILKLFLFTILLSLLSFPIISCGLPDVTGITLELNQPYITKVIPGNNQLTVEFEAQNNEPSFSGYNIYFGDSTDPRKYRLYNQQKALPTISDKTSTVIKKYSFTIKVGSYFSTNGTDVYTLKESDLNNGIPVYVWVSAYQITPQLESYYYYDNFVKMGTPRPEALNQTVTPNNNISMEGRDLARLIVSGGNLYFQNVGGTSMMAVSGNSLNDVVIPPENGYGNVDLQVKANRLYLIKITDGNNAYYGKIYVRSVNGTSSITVDYCRQTSANILSY